ncbi:MAG: MFS transporter [Catenulispora sp.]|nr:MFS transporter [Catenulispora sp.]
MPQPAAQPITSGWLARRFGGLPRSFWVLFAGVGFMRIGFVVIPFRAFYLAHERHLSSTAAALVMTAFGIGWAVSQPIGGVLADRLGRRTVIIASAVVSAGAALAYGAAHTFGTLAVTAVLVGLSFDLYRPAVQALMTDSVRGSDQSRALALLYLVMNVGRGVACLLGGLLADHAFWSLFLLNAVINLGFAATVWRAFPSGPSTAQAQRQPGRLRAMADRRLIAFTVITGLFYLVHMQSVVTLPLVINQAGASPLAFGAILALDPLAVALVQLLLQHWITRTSALLVCAFGVAITGVGLAITGMGHSVLWFAATTPIWVGGEVLFLTVAPGVVAGLAPAHARGSYFGSWGSTQGSAAVVAPLVASALIAVGGTSLLWIAGAVVGLVTGLACLVLRTWLSRPPPDVSAPTATSGH